MQSRKINIEIPDVEKFIDGMNNKKFMLFEAEHIWEIGYNTLPHCDVKTPIDYPNCCAFHRGINNNAVEWFNKFPNCCEKHKTLIGKKWFKKELYAHVPNKIVEQWNYLESFMDENIVKENWYQEITDYFEYTFSSFGTPSAGSSIFVGNLLHYLQNNKSTDNFPTWKQKRLLEYVNQQIEDAKNSKGNSKTDLNILFGTYQKWVKNLPKFIMHKKSLESYFPMNLLLHSPQYNKFTELTKFKTRTKGEFIEILINITKTLLKDIDTPKMVAKNLINDTQKHQLDILSEQHKLRQSSLLDSYSKREMKYIQILKTWLKNEKTYFNDLNPIVSSIPSTVNNVIVNNNGNDNIINTGDNNKISNHEIP